MTYDSQKRRRWMIAEKGKAWIESRSAALGPAWLKAFGRCSRLSGVWAPVVSLVLFSACTPLSSSRFGDSPESVNYSPFESNQSIARLDNGETFYSLALKATFTESKGGSDSPLSQTPGSFGDNEGVIDELSAFRKKAELYLVTSGQPLTSGSVVVGSASFPLAKSEWVVRDKAYGLVTLAPYPTAGASVTVKSGNRTTRFVVPKLFSPYVLVRYEQGAMMPTPMRADTIVVDLDRGEMSVLYRTTLPTEPAIRRVEYRLISDPIEPHPNETIEQTREKFAAQQRYLMECPIPTSPVEPCAIPVRLPARAFFE